MIQGFCPTANHYIIIIITIIIIIIFPITLI